MTAKLAAALFAVGVFAVPAAYGAGDTANATTHKSTSATDRTKHGLEDSVITTKIKAEFAKDKQVSAMHIKVDTENNGVVTLSGTAKSQAETDKAVSIARNTKGVTSVRNDIKVGTESGTTPSSTAASHPSTAASPSSTTASPSKTTASPSKSKY